MSIFFILTDMDVTDWNNSDIMRLVMAKGHITQKVLLKSFKELTGVDIPQSTLSCKIKRNGLKLSEFQNICKILGYKIRLERLTD